MAEIDRELEDGEEVRIGVIVKMPFEDEVEPVAAGRRNIFDDEDEDDDMEETGWQGGMEMGVWEGFIRRHRTR